MKLIILILGVLSLAYEGECQLTWTTPPAKDDNGIVKWIDQTDDVAATIYDFALAVVTEIVITSQTPTGIFTTVTVGSNTGPLKLAASQNIDYTAATSHVLIIEATDSGTSVTETATLTLAVNPIAFTSPIQCFNLFGDVAAATLATATPIGASAITKAQVGTTTTGYTFTVNAGTLANDAAITPATTPVQITVVSTAVEAFGTTTTATSTMHLCINNGCECSSVLAAASTASTITSGLLSVIMVLMLKLK